MIESSQNELPATECPTVIMYTDPGRDSDDTMSFIIASRLQRLFKLGLRVAVTTLTPAKRRAELAQFIVDNVNLDNTRVVGGSDLPQILSEDNIHAYEFANIPEAYGRERITVDRDTPITIALESAPPKSVDVLVIAGFTDLDYYLQDEWGVNQARFKYGVKELVVMGGVLTENGIPVLDQDGFLQIDSSSNYQFDRPAAERVIRFAQENNIPIRFISRHAAYAAQLPRDAYDKAAETGNPVGKWLQNAISAGFQSLWERANMPADAPGRALPARCDRDWFMKTFCGGQDIAISAEESIWPYIQAITPYDPLAMLGTVPELIEKFYEPYYVTINGTRHEIIGLSPEVTGVKNPEELRSFLQESLIRGLETVNEEQNDTQQSVSIPESKEPMIFRLANTDPSRTRNLGSLFTNYNTSSYPRRGMSFRSDGKGDTVVPKKIFNL